MRIKIASSGYYYVQRPRPFGGWVKVGGFFKTRAGARQFARDYRAMRTWGGTNRTVEYV